MHEFSADKQPHSENIVNVHNADVLNFLTIF